MIANSQSQRANEQLLGQLLAVSLYRISVCEMFLFFLLFGFFEFSEVSMNIDFTKLYEDKCWKDVIELWGENSELFTGNVALNVLAEAHRQLGDINSAGKAISDSIDVNPNNNWTRVIKFNVDEQRFGVEYALDELYQYLLVSNFSSESLIRIFVDKSVSVNEFSRSQEANSHRSVIRSGIGPKYCIALQCFNKADVLRKVLDRLIKCNSQGDFELIIIQDMYLEEDAGKYQEGWNDVRSLLKEFYFELVAKFGSVTVIYNNENLGTAPTCKKLLDRASKLYEGFVFIEDNCLLSKDALVLSKEFLRNHVGMDSKYWFATCESINFDSKSNEVSEEQVNNVLPSESDLNQWKAMCGELNFVPSTCFITTSQVWREVSNIRGFVRGPESLSKYTSSLGKKTLFPLIPRASDIGMLHALGYSVKHLSLEGVKEIKNTYYFPDYHDTDIELSVAEQPLVDMIYSISTAKIQS